MSARCWSELCAQPRNNIDDSLDIDESPERVSPRTHDDVRAASILHRATHQVLLPAALLGVLHLHYRGDLARVFGWAQLSASP